MFVCSFKVFDKTHVNALKDEIYETTIIDNSIQSNHLFMSVHVMNIDTQIFTNKLTMLGVCVCICLGRENIPFLVQLLLLLDGRERMA